MKMPGTLQGEFIYYPDVAKTYELYKSNPKFKPYLDQLMVDLKHGTWDKPKPFDKFSNHNKVEHEVIRDQVKNSTYSRTLRGSGILVDDLHKSYKIPDGFTFNKKTKQALLKLRQDGYKRSDSIS